MSSLYPTLEDMKVGQVIQAQQAYMGNAHASAHAIAYSPGQTGPHAAAAAAMNSAPYAHHAGGPHAAAMNHTPYAHHTGPHAAAMNSTHYADPHAPAMNSAPYANPHAATMNSAPFGDPHAASMNSAPYAHHTGMNSAPYANPHAATMNSAHHTGPHAATMNSAPFGDPHAASMNSTPFGDPHAASMNSTPFGDPHAASMNSALYAHHTGPHTAAMNSAPYTDPHAVALNSIVYPSLMDYMGMAITQEMVNHNHQLVAQNNQVAQRYTSTGHGQVAPITGNDLGVRKAEIRQGIREVILCKDQDGKIGFRVQAVNKGVFVAFVHNGSPAALAGLRFGDQILQINEETVAGWDTDTAAKFLKKALPQKITLAIRDRPFERTVSMQKDNTGTLGFVFKDNKITAIVKDSSAARNGILTEHHLVEVNGQNVIGMKEKDVKPIFDSSPRTVTITIVPSFVYEHMMKNIGSSLVRNHMDHSIPDL